MKKFIKIAVFVLVFGFASLFATKAVFAEDCTDTMPTGTVNNGSATLVVPEGACPIEVSFSSYSFATTALPYEEQVLLDNITDTYGPGIHNIGPINLSCNWQADLYIGPVQTNLLPGIGHDQSQGPMLSFSIVENQVCDGVDNNLPVENTSRIVATKIVCPSESDLPNWSGGVDIASTTATDFIASHPQCRLEPNWQFQVEYRGPNHPGLPLDPGGSFVGEAPNWGTFPNSTDSNGVTSVDFDVNDVWHFWVREVLKEGYIPFAAPENPQSDVSAEMYCHKDVQNYDNIEQVNGEFNSQTGFFEAFEPELTFYCVAFNVPKAPATGNLVIEKVVINDNGGTGTTTNFSFQVNATSTTVFESDGANNLTLNVGAYAITEVPVSGYTASYSAGCNGTLLAGSTTTCTVTNNDNPAGQEGSTIVATKIVCASESDLPNWSGSSTIAIGPTTAADFIATHPNCHLEPNWEFQVRYWSQADQTGGVDPRTPDPGGAFIGATTSPWTTIAGQTNGAGVLSTTFNPTNVWHFWIREVLKPNYLSFAAPSGGGPVMDTYTPSSPDEENSFPSGNVSAELYCATDVLNYNNLERVDGPFSNGDTFYCVAFNVPTAETERGNVIVIKNVINDNGGTKQVADFSLKVGTTTVASGATTTLSVGSYIVSETFDSTKYSQSFSGDCDASGNLTVSTSTTRICVITNNDIAEGIGGDGGGGGSSSGRRRGGSGGVVQGINTQSEPQVLGIEYEIIPLGLPSTGLGPISSTSNGSSGLGIIFSGLALFLSLNLVAIYAIKRKSL